jgi:hypothetical protein
VIIEILYARSSFLINERMVDRADRGSSFNTGEAIDRKDLLEPLMRNLLVISVGAKSNIA